MSSSIYWPCISFLPCCLNESIFPFASSSKQQTISTTTISPTTGIHSQSSHCSDIDTNLHIDVSLSPISACPTACSHYNNTLYALNDSISLLRNWNSVTYSSNNLLTISDSSEEQSGEIPNVSNDDVSSTLLDLLSIIGDATINIITDNLSTNDVKHK